MPFLSIIIPVYNAEKYLNDLFADIKRQSFADYEVIIIDDGSKDNSPQICDQYAADDIRVKVLHVSNGGSSKARNIGYRKFSGEYVYCMDHDDRVYGDSLFQSIFDSISKNPVDILQMGAKYFKEGETIPRKVLEMPEIPECDIACPAKTIYGLMKTGKYEISCWTKVINRDFLLANEFFWNESLSTEDLDWNMQFLSKIKRYNLLKNSDYRHIYRLGSLSSQRGERGVKNALDQIAVIHHWYDFWQRYAENKLLRDAALGYLCYQFFIALGLVSVLDFDKKAIFASKLRETSGVMKYALGYREKLAYWIYYVFGFHFLSFVVELYYRHFRTAAK